VFPHGYRTLSGLPTDILWMTIELRGTISIFWSIVIVVDRMHSISNGPESKHAMKCVALAPRKSFVLRAVAVMRVRG
jgi:hypothetical protein